MHVPRGMAAQSASDFPEQFKPGCTYSFPKRKFGKGKDERSFRAVISMNGYTTIMLINILLSLTDHERKFLASTTSIPQGGNNKTSRE